ncbi:hypothetical protein [Paraferrimonas sedimenticola]|uniref:Uncharacterized protein n=1 Tax=Paraferrimonas sedimenticola TaxID=375674 RepID=A0AA37W0Z9_9GAMM|nr:hypothetical protein [Paraferrimonas sedimenticola]GLP96820.1 hypothetical protein GCM10007895_21260 [Paraferrimonas sedimenticola]
MTRLFLIPLIICIGWTLFLLANGWSIEQGKKGYFIIIGASTAIIGFLSLMLWLTQYQ